HMWRGLTRYTGPRYPGTEIIVRRLSVIPSAKRPDSRCAEIRRSSGFGAISSPRCLPGGCTAAWRTSMRSWANEAYSRAGTHTDVQSDPVFPDVCAGWRAPCARGIDRAPPRGVDGKRISRPAGGIKLSTGCRVDARPGRAEYFGAFWSL